MGVPATLLRKLYVENSLRNTENGFQFQLKNRLAPATIVRFGSLSVADQEIPARDVVLKVKQNTYLALDVSERRPIRFGVNEIMTVSVTAPPLPAGHHVLTCDVYVKEVGWLHIPVEDVLAEPAMVTV